jgi:hypothetical protein
VVDAAAGTSGLAAVRDQVRTGRATTSANLASTGKRDHQAKTDRLLRVSGDANDVLRYSTSTGHTYESRPHRYLRPSEPPF